MVRTLDLTASVGRLVAVDRDRGVCRDAASVAELSASLESDGVEGAEIMSAPGESVVSGLG